MRFFQINFSRVLEEYRSPKKMAGSVFAVILSLFISLLVGYQALTITLKERSIHRDLKTLEENVAKTKETNNELDNEIENTRSPETIERLAKEELNLQKPGEMVAVIVSSASTSAPQIPPKPSFWRRFEDLIFFR